LNGWQGLPSCGTRWLRQRSGLTRFTGGRLDGETALSRRCADDPSARLAWRVLALAVPGLLLPVAFASAKELTSSVSYVTSSMIYVDAGTDQGLTKGALLDFRRDGVSLARLPVVSLSSKRCACQAPASPEIRVGDAVVFTATPPASARLPAPPAEPTPLHFPEARSIPRGRLPGTWRGRAGLRFMARTDATEFGTDTYQPSLDLRADADNFGRPELSIQLDVRTRRTFTSSSLASRSSDGRTRVHRAAAQWRRPGSPWFATGGRQVVTAVASVGILDGLALERQGERWATGVLAGTLPDPATYGFSSAIRQVGVYVARSGGPQATARWRIAAALLGAYENRRVKREHLALQGRWSRSRVFASALQEVDVNRSWRAANAPALTLTSSFCTLRVAASEHLSWNGGFDARRSLPLFRDTITPETEFDDSYRRGYWTGVSVRPQRNVRMELSGRRSTGTSAGAANSATARFRFSVPRLLGASLSSRHTLYDNDHARGALHSVTGGIDVGKRTRIESTWGIRRERNPGALAAVAETSNDAGWWSMEVQAYLARGWYVTSDVEHTAGDQENNTLVFLTAIHRFE
jgi:hypothetical protein